MINSNVKTILSYYAGENPGIRNNLAKILNHGTLGGTLWIMYHQNHRLV
jgi:class I fructose-bisphosphate aldolase